MLKQTKRIELNELTCIVLKYFNSASVILGLAICSLNNALPRRLTPPSLLPGWSPRLCLPRWPPVSSASSMDPHLHPPSQARWLWWPHALLSIPRLLPCAWKSRFFSLTPPAPPPGRLCVPFLRGSQPLLRLFMRASCWREVGCT